MLDITPNGVIRLRKRRKRMKKLIEVEAKSNVIVLTLLWVLEFVGCIVAVILEANQGLFKALAIVNLICVLFFGILFFVKQRLFANIAMVLFTVMSLIEFCVNIAYISYNPGIIALLLLPILGVVSIVVGNNYGKITVTDKGVVFEQTIGDDKVLRAANIPIEKVCFVKRGLFKSIIIAAPSGRICAYSIKEIDELYDILCKLANKDEDIKSE